MYGLGSTHTRRRNIHIKISCHTYHPFFHYHPLVTTTLLNTPSIRHALGLPAQKVEEPVYKPPRETKAKGIEGLRERLSDNLSEMQKGVSDQIGNMTNQYSGTAEERAEQARKNQIRKLEEMRRKLEREEFDKKYKR